MSTQPLSATEERAAPRRRTSPFDLDVRSTASSRRRFPATSFSWVAPWSSVLLALVLSIPIATVLVSLFIPVGGVWSEFVGLTLREYLITTAQLVAGVAIGAFVVGTGLAWLVTMCRFPGSRAFEYLLLLPLAMPAYLMAYTYADLLQFTGPVQSSLRSWFGWGKDDYWFPAIRSLPGAIVVMTFVLYPYVYLLARGAFLQQSTGVLDAGRSLGLGPWRTFGRIGLPLARPAIAAGVALAGMEALADYGTVKHFEVNTLSTGVYLSWFSLGEPVGAAKLASGLLLFVVVVLAIERLARGKRRYAQVSGQFRPCAPIQLNGLSAALATIACLLPTAIGFVVPASRLSYFAVQGGDPLLGRRFLTLAWHSLTLAGLAALVTVSIATLLAYGLRLAPSRALRASTRVATLGYAIPGAVIAVGVMLPFGHADNAIDRFMQRSFGLSTGLLLSGTIFTLIFAYLIRFLTIGFSSVESGLARITPSLDEAARNLGEDGIGAARRVHLPLMRGALLTGALLVFVDTLKELPATLILRPFNYDTLAVRVYQLASDERLAEASTAALAIVAVGLLPVMLLSVAIARSRPNRFPGASRDPASA